MTNKLNAGDFESRFADILADALATGQQMDIKLVAECYKQAAASLGLASTGADDLHIKDMHSAMSVPGALPAKANAKALRNKIFDLIYMH